MSIATVILDRRGPTTWSASYLGKTIVETSRDPEHAACRALKALGVAGRVAFRRSTSGTVGLTMGIEWGANHATDESPRDGRPRTVKYRRFIRPVARQ